MRLFYVSSGCGFHFQHYLSDEDENIISAFREIAGTTPDFHFDTFLLQREPLKRLSTKLASFRPDFILVFRGYRLPTAAVQQLRKSQVPFGIWVVDDPYRLKTHEQLVKPYPFVFTQDSGSVSFYRSMGKKAFHLPLAVNPAKYRPVRVPAKYRSDICFVGSAFPVRLHFFDQMTPFLLKKRFIIIGQWWERLKNYHKLKHRIRNQPIPPSEVVKYYNGAKIVLNIHRTHNDRRDNHLNLPACSPNNRTFEIAACRSFQLLTCRRDLKRFYVPGQEMVCFQNIQDLKRKINYYLSHDDERNRIAVKSYQRTLRDHTYHVRLRYLLHLLDQHLGGRAKAAEADQLP